MNSKLWKFTDNSGAFVSRNADKTKGLYFPLCNESLMSSITPDLHGDIKTSQNSFLLTPVSRIDLVDSRSSRNFWAYINKDKIWSATGVSKDQKQIERDQVKLEAGLLWHKVTRENKYIGLKAEILVFIPSSGEPVEVMQVRMANTSRRKITFIPTAAIPIYARGANNLRDHRHVTSLLQRITLHKYGVIVRPTLKFDESGHKPNKTNYFVLGWDQKSRAPQYIYPTQELFCGEAGDLEAPASVLKNLPPERLQIQGREAMGGLRFSKTTLAPGESRTYIILLGITDSVAEIQRTANKFSTPAKVRDSLQKTKEFWIKESSKIYILSGSPDFDNWFRWVSIQPVLRKVFGCSFLPDFDYGKGGRGWRDLWQDCLGLILNDPAQVRKLLINNFSGVRIDGSNATIIGKKQGEFISDRNNLSRVWMDHGIWPLLTLDLYLNETGDYGILFEEVPYFRDHQFCRARERDKNWDASQGSRLKTKTGRIYKGTIFEHLLVQGLVQFFNVGPHNHIRLEGADWNDGLDMAQESGESVAFSSMYAHNLKLLSDLLSKTVGRKIKLAGELKILLRKINYNSIGAKQKLLREYFERTKGCVSGRRLEMDSNALAEDLRNKSGWMMRHIRKKEWLRGGFFNGYYDNNKKRVEGLKDNLIRMALASQVFPIISGAAVEWQVEAILKSAKKYLLDKKFKGFRLNTDYKKEQYAFGRAFSFIYGDKENGAFFNHMSVMFAYALYLRGYVSEGWQVLSSIYKMAAAPEAKIYPCLPEYFNGEGRGMYSYLTGSASWFILTMLTQVFGIRGQGGDLLIDPKLHPGQFKNTETLAIARNFSGRRFRIIFSNPKKLPYGRYRITQARLNSQNLCVRQPQYLVIPRAAIIRLPKNKINSLSILLG